MAGEMELVQTQPSLSGDEINPLKLPKLQVDGGLQQHKVANRPFRKMLKMN
jgi:hypothetical protein